MRIQLVQNLVNAFVFVIAVLGTLTAVLFWNDVPRSDVQSMLIVGAALGFPLALVLPVVDHRIVLNKIAKMARGDRWASWSARRGSCIHVTHTRLVNGLRTRRDRWGCSTSIHFGPDLIVFGQRYLKVDLSRIARAVVSLGEGSGAALVIEMKQSSMTSLETYGRVTLETVDRYEISVDHEQLELATSLARRYSTMGRPSKAANHMVRRLPRAA